MDENSNNSKVQNQTRIGKLEREYEETFRKEMKILDENNFWNLETSEQWKYILFLQEQIKKFIKDISHEVNKQSINP